MTSPSFDLVVPNLWSLQVQSELHGATVRWSRDGQVISNYDRSLQSLSVEESGPRSMCEGGSYV
jgi:hypothetical protein